MSHWSRRETLAAVVGGVTALAGCRSTTEDETPVREPGREVENYHVERVRDADGAVLFGQSAEDGPTENGPTENESTENESMADGPARERSADVGGMDYLTDETAFEETPFGDSRAARRLREFAGETDFENRSVYLYAQSVAACYDLRLESVRLDDNGPHVQFCRDRRPADAACGADAHVSVGYAVRLPFAGDDHSGLGSGLRGSCGGPVRPEPFESNVTVADGGAQK